MEEAKAAPETGACGRAASRALAGTLLQFWDFSQAPSPVADHRTMELFRLEIPSKIKKPIINPAPPPCLLNHVLQSHIHVFFEHFHGW